MRIDWQFKAAAYVAWLAIAVPTFVDIWTGRLTGARAVVWTLAFALFGATYAAYLRPYSSLAPRVRAVATISVLSALALTMVVTSIGLMKYLASVTLTIVAGELPYVLSARLVWMWIVLQSAALMLVFWLSFGWVSALAGGFAYAGFQIFAVGRTWLEQQERLARQELANTVTELRATRALFAESSRVAERVRISRDLHDSLGHHLTALGLQLEVASRRIDGPPAAHVHEAQEITRLMLADVRDVVGQLRQRGRIELATAVRSLATHDTIPRVHVDLPDTLAVDRPAEAHVLLRCAQEIVTNARKHASARNVWIRVEASADGIELRARDDGAGTPNLVHGHGLIGMRERFEEYGGSVEFLTAPGEGFAVRAFLPCVGAWS